jgi:hypothetical protein
MAFVRRSRRAATRQFDDSPALASGSRWSGVDGASMGLPDDFRVWPLASLLRVLLRVRKKVAFRGRRSARALDLAQEHRAAIEVGHLDHHLSRHEARQALP